MKFVAKFVTLIALIGISQQAMADPAPSDVQGFYRGKGNFSSTFSKEKQPRLDLGLEIPNGTDVILSMFEDGVNGGDILGQSIYAPEFNFLLVKFDVASDVSFSGLLKIKGKPGKKSISGTLTVIQEGYVGLGGIKLKVKQSLPF